MYSTVLVVDDSLIARMKLKKAVDELFPESEVLQAESGLQAVSKAKSSKPGLALLDYNMPGLDGLETAEELQKLNKDIVIVLITADSQHSLQDKCDQMGVQYLKKPVGSDNLDVIRDELKTMLNA